VTRGPIGKAESNLLLERRDNLREIRMSCRLTGMYADWLLTPAQGGTFVEVEMGIETRRISDRIFDRAAGKVYFRRWASQSLDALRDAALSAARQLPSQAVVSTNQFKNGMHVEVDGKVFRIVEFQHVKPGKGGAFVRTKLKRVDDGAVIDRTFRAGQKFRPVRTEARKMTFLYADGTDAHFMDSQTYDQMAVPEDSVKESLKWVIPNQEVDILYVDESPADVQVPSAVELAVSETDPGLRGDTASGGGDKPATLESGVVVRVPLFVNVGDRVRVDTRSGEYVSRA
jgi:elongation factor P